MSTSKCPSWSLSLFFVQSSAHPDCDGSRKMLPARSEQLVTNVLLPLTAG